MRPQRSYGPKHITQTRARASLQMLLTGCTKERLQGFTAAGLHAAYNVSLATAEQMLAAAKERRG